MVIIRTVYLNELFVILTMFISIRSEQQQSSDQLLHILSSLKPIRSQYCQFKFENCIQDLSYADQLDTVCNIYSRLRDCFRLLLDDKECSTSQLKHQYKKTRENEYQACNNHPSSYQSIRSSWYTSLSSKLKTTSLTTYILFFLLISFVFI